MKLQKEWTAEHPNLRKSFSCSRLVGVEWEYNNSSYTNEINKWIEKWGGEKHSDGSCGLEMVTPPIAGDHLVNCLTQLGESFKKDSAKADQSCSIHVHVDARDLGWADMYKLLKVYAHVEPILYILGGQNRIKSTYCKPCGPEYIKALSKEDCKGEILAVAYLQSGAKNARQYIRGRPVKKDGGRYRGLNLCPWLCGRRIKVRKNTGPTPITPRSDFSNLSLRRMKDATVEFRIHRNTLDADRVIGWTKICARLVDWASKASEIDIQNLPKSSLRALCQIAPDCTSWIMGRVKDWRNATRSDTGVPRRISFKDGKYQYKADF